MTEAKSRDYKAERRQAGRNKFMAGERLNTALRVIYTDPRWAAVELQNAMKLLGIEVTS